MPDSSYCEGMTNEPATQRVFSMTVDPFSERVMDITPLVELMVKSHALPSRMAWNCWLGNAWIGSWSMLEPPGHAGEAGQ